MNEKERVPGNTTVAPEVLETIIQMTADDTQGVARLYTNNNNQNGVKMKITDGTVNADVYIVLESNCSTLEVCKHLQSKIARAIKEMVGMSVGYINIHIEDFNYPEMRETMAALKERTYLRGIALQALYEYDLTGHSVTDILTNRFETEDVPDDDAKKFVIDLVVGVINNKNEIDGLINKYAEDWPIDQIAAIDRNIIRIAAYEFAVSKETPDKVAINESVELAKAFGSDTAPKFVNGVLGSIADNLTNTVA